MKKSILIFVLLLSNFLFSQDSIQLTFKSKEEAIKFTKDIITSSENAIIYDKDTIFDQRFLIKYTSTVTSLKGVLFEFKVTGDFGKEIYVFKVVVGTYEVLFPAWKKYFNPNANFESTKSQNYQVRSLNFDHDILFQKDVDVWKIGNLKLSK